MKKYILCLLILTSFVGQTYDLNAQYRRYPKPQKFDGDGAGIGGGEDAVVDRYGNPTCCENNSEFNFSLTFSNFSVLTNLDSQMAAARRARKKVDDWLKRQEGTFLREINKQMRTNYASFSTAQREYFKFYEKGGHSNNGVVTRTFSLSAEEKQRKASWQTKSDKLLVQVAILDNWIACGYCDELTGYAYDVNGLGNYDSDSGPGPKFYASNVRNSTAEDFGDAYYLSGFHESRGQGLNALAQNGLLLNRLSDIRVKHYRNLGWEDKVFQMSAYLIHYNQRGTCPIPMGNCLPASLSEYTPKHIWDDNSLYKWAMELAPEIQYEKGIFSKDYIEYLIKTEGLSSYSATITAKAERKAVLEDNLDFILPDLLTEQTTRSQLISEIRIYTDVIEEYGLPSEKQLVGYLKEINKSFSDFSNAELYDYYLMMRKLRWEMQLNRVKIILFAVAESFEPVIEFALWEVGGSLAIKLLSKLPAVAKTSQLTGVLDNLKITNSLSKFKNAQKFGFKSYLEHVNFFNSFKISRSKLGIEVHHLIEKRFASNPKIAQWLGSNSNNWKSIVLTKEEHAIFTAAWRNAIGYQGKAVGSSGFRTLDVPLEVLKNEARRIYKDYPDILKALGL